jgi:hypothetical protein
MAKTSKAKPKWGVFGGHRKKAQEKKWELKPIPEKKEKKPQKMMEQYFPIVKAKAPQPPPMEVNFQGFPLSQCRFAPDIGTFVYCPPAYGGGQRRRERRVCPDCYLSPRIVEEKNEEIFQICMNMPVSNWHSQKEMDEGYETALPRHESVPLSRPPVGIVTSWPGLINTTESSQHVHTPTGCDTWIHNENLVHKFNPGRDCTSQMSYLARGS